MTAKTTAQLAWELLDWNRQNLVHDSRLTEAVIAEKFAREFTVRANGRVYQADYASYLEFLNHFRQAIGSIDYDIHHIVSDQTSAAVALSARIRRTDQRVDQFEAMLLLEFDETQLVKLWNEVYVQIV